jgi:hypothetical protein
MPRSDRVIACFGVGTKEPHDARESIAEQFGCVKEPDRSILESYEFGPEDVFCFVVDLSASAEN